MVCGCRVLQGQLTALQASHQAEKDKVVRAEEAKRRREDEARIERRSPVAEYCDMLTAQGEGQFKDSLIGMGMNSDVPKLFRHNGRVCPFLFMLGSWNARAPGRALSWH